MKRSRPVSTEGGRKVKHVVRQFCKSSSVEIPDSALAEVRSLAQQGGDVRVRELFDAVWQELRAQRCRARLGAVLLADHLLLRSALFRRLACARLREFSEWTIGISGSAFPPPEDPERGMLRTSAIGFLKSWHDRFVPTDDGEISPATTDAVRQLHMEFVFLRDKLQIPFVDVAREQERVREEQALERRRAAERERAIKEFAELKVGVLSNLNELENALAILFPSFEERFDNQVQAAQVDLIDQLEPDDEVIEWEDEDEAGIHAQDQDLDQRKEQRIGGLTDDFAIDITFSTRATNSDESRAPLVQAANDAVKILIRTHIPKLHAMRESLGKNDQLEELWAQSMAVLDRSKKLLA